MSVVIKLSFSAKVERKGRPKADKRKYIALKTRPPFGSTLNFDPKGGHKGAEKGKNGFAKRYTRCDAGGKREYLRM